MSIKNQKLPVLVLNCKLGALGIMRTLGKLDVPVYGVDSEPQAPGLLSRYCAGRFILHFDEKNPDDYLAAILEIGRQMNTRMLLIPTSDELALFAVNFFKPLRKYFIFPQNDPSLIRSIISKEGMYSLAIRNNVPTPTTLFPKSLQDVNQYLKDLKFPVMLKGIHGNRMQEKTGKKMVIINSEEELVENYNRLEDPAEPNLMIQEYIPGNDDQIFIFNGYFNEKSECLAAFTGHKIRQYPVHIGCASLGICKWNQEVADITIAFMKDIGYRGVLDIGYRMDPRDGLYKVLDINPRVGQAFRLFVSEDDTDVVKCLYKDFTGQKLGNFQPQEGRRWVIEDFDIESSLDYYREGILGLKEWIGSYRDVCEAAWFDMKDLRPFLFMCSKFISRFQKWLLKRLKNRKALMKWGD